MDRGGQSTALQKGMRLLADVDPVRLPGCGFPLARVGNNRRYGPMLQSVAYSHLKSFFCQLFLQIIIFSLFFTISRYGVVRQ